MKRIKFCLILFLQITLLFGQKSFSFVYLPDIHLQPDSAVLANFRQMAGQVNRLRPDFVLTGGDMIYTAKNVDDKKAEKLFDLMDTEFRQFKMPVYLTMGNHENVGITAESGIDKTNPMWGKRMFEIRYNKRYYTFTYSGWKFFILDGIRILEAEKNYTQGVDSIQMDWIRNELLTTAKRTPIVISIHTPLVNPHAVTDPGSQLLSASAVAVLDMFRDYDLRLVLEGHTHIYMDLLLKGVHYISGGSTAYGTDSLDFGIVQVKIKKDTEKIQFVRPLKQPIKNQQTN